MTRRKFEITAHMNERDFPHIEALRDDAAGVVGLELSRRHTADFWQGNPTEPCRPNAEMQDDREPARFELGPQPRRRWPRFQTDATPIPVCESRALLVKMKRDLENPATAPIKVHRLRTKAPAAMLLSSPVETASSWSMPALPPRVRGSRRPSQASAPCITRFRTARSA